MTARRVRVGPEPAIALDVEGAGDLVVMLHGIGGGRVNWRRQLPALGAHFTAAAWDARGYGASDDYEGPLAFSDFSDDLIRVLDYFDAEKAHLVGLSMGGRIALDFYGRHPDRVRTLVLADTSAGHPGAADPAKIEEALNLRKKPLLEGRTPADIAPGMARHMAGPTVSEETFALLVESLAALRTDSYIKTLDAVTRYFSFPEPESITVPTLVINGANDPIAQPEAARRFAERMPNHEFVLLENAGHVSNIEQPEAFNAAVLDFLMRHQTEWAVRQPIQASTRAAM